MARATGSAFLDELPGHGHSVPFQAAAATLATDGPAHVVNDELSIAI
ncbi:MAG: hypothetical protein V3U39_06975 [Acidimicrobiia bacterium]